MIGNHNKNPLLNTLVYDVEFPDGAAKLFLENALAKCDMDGFYTNVMEEILEKCVMEHRCLYMISIS